MSKLSDFLNMKADSDAEPTITATAGDFVQAYKAGKADAASEQEETSNSTELQDANDKLSARVTELEAELETVKAENAALEGKLVEANAKADALQAQLDEFASTAADEEADAFVEEETAKLPEGLMQAKGEKIKKAAVKLYKGDGGEEAATAYIESEKEDYEALAATFKKDSAALDNDTFNAWTASTGSSSSFGAGLEGN